ncbi:DNA polymerase III subunit gamma/tau [Candidatus Ishikawella capsulata]|nr:DNA polymerase III subunit gamma/tau [Candidatus Ishikawaella capsulata]
MYYQVLARKWRPQVFTDVAGQDYVLTALSNSLSMDKVHHAYLFSGTRGVGKTTIARLLAKGLNCKIGITSKFCSKCANCLEIEQGRFVDLIEIDAASRTKVEDTRELLENVQYVPVRGRFKIYLIDEVHMLSRYSFNALLKILEEPPMHVKFLLATTDPQKLPITVLSRCLRFHLKALDVDQIFHKLQSILEKEEIVYELQALRLLAYAANGSMRDALSLTEQAIAMGLGKVNTVNVNLILGILDDEKPLKLIEALFTKNVAYSIDLLDQIALYGIEWDAILAELLSLLHRIAILKFLPNSLGDNRYIKYDTELKELSRKISFNQIQLYYQILSVGRKDLMLAPNPRIGVEMILLRAITFKQQERIDETPICHHNNIILKNEKDLMPKPSGRLSNISEMIDQYNTEKFSEIPESISKKEQKKIVCDEGVDIYKPLVPYVNSYKKELKKNSDVSEKKELMPEKFLNNSTNINTVLSPCIDNTKREQYAEWISLLIRESQKRDVWAAQIDSLELPQMVRLLALNSWKEEKLPHICLHLRSSHRHLHTVLAQKTLVSALSQLLGNKIELSIIEDDNPEILTPIEWQNFIYKEKLEQVTQSIAKDSKVQVLRTFFSSDLEEESIKPL